MTNIIVQQPNGLYCIFSHTTNCPIHFNITREEYIKARMEYGKMRAEQAIDNAYPFDEVIKSFTTTNMTEDEFNDFLIKVGSDYRYIEPKD